MFERESVCVRESQRRRRRRRRRGDVERWLQISKRLTLKTSSDEEEKNKTANTKRKVTKSQDWLDYPLREKTERKRETN